MTIWISRDFEHKVNSLSGDTASIDGKAYKRLTPVMFAKLYTRLRASADTDTLTSSDISKITSLENTIISLGLAEEYYSRIPMVRN